MFDALTGRLDAVFRKLRQRGKLHPKQVDSALADIRTALIEADASVEVVDDFLSRVRAVEFFPDEGRANTGYFQRGYLSLPVEVKDYV